MAFTCDPKDPRAPGWLKVACRNLRWVPFIFIAGLIGFAYLTVTVSLALRYHVARKGEWGSALIELLLATILAGGAVWSFIVAVFRDPGSPHGRAADRERWGSRRGSAYELDEEGEEAQSLMRSQPEHRSATGNQEDAHAAHDSGEGRGARAALFEVPIPGQPQYPARSGREQLDDLRRQASSPLARARVERRAEIWVKSSGESRWCNKCDAPKPDRTHHCSTCGRCVLRMDHHCPWLANRCVGLRNHKAFFLFISYTALFCVYCCQETARALLRYVEYEQHGFESSPITWAVVLFLGFIFGASLVPFAGYHAWLICRNRTTIENMEGSGRIRLRVKRDAARPRVEDRLRSVMGSAEPSPRREEPRGGAGGWRSDEHLTRDERRALKKASKLNVYDVGAPTNWRQVMGEVWYLWFVPVGEPLSDGVSFLVDTHTLKELECATAAIRVRDTPQQPRTDEDHDEDEDSVYGDRESTRFGYAEQAHRDDGLARTPGQRFQGAHGEMEWGDTPKKSFVLFGVDDDDEDRT